MADKTTASRADLAQVAGLVRPALATRDYVPALTHIRFGGGRATAFNDVAAISVRCAADVGRCVPGELFIRALGSFGGADVLIQRGDGGALSLRSGRATVRLPTLPESDFPFEWPGPNDGTEVPFGRELVRAVERCLVGVGGDSAHPAQMGVTLETEDGMAVLYSTDNYTVSRCATAAEMRLPADAPVILPRFFCEQLVALSRAFPDEGIVLVLHDTAVVAEFGKSASLLTKTPVDVAPLDFPRLIRKHCDLGTLQDALQLIPDAFDAALGRAALVLSGEAAKSTRVSARKGQLRMVSACDMGDADDEMPFPGDDLEEVCVDPALVARGAKACALVGFTERVTVMADADCQFVHLVAHVDGGRR